MHFRSILLFIFQLYFSLCLGKKTKTVENYVIDVLFSNTLTIIRCNRYESHIFREISIEILGHIQCSNKHQFLPDNHIENITLLQWTATTVNCNNKKSKIIDEETTFLIKHKPKHAFKKTDFKMIRFGSTGKSDVKIDDKKRQITVKHPARNLQGDEIESTKDNFTINIYSIRDRPILCWEKQLITDNLCNNQHFNLSFICYYRIGFPESPTYADMENELQSLSEVINIETETHIDRYINNQPDTPLFFGLPIPAIFGIIGGIAIIIVIIIIIICCCCSGDNNDDHVREKERLRHNDSDTSNLS